MTLDDFYSLDLSTQTEWKVISSGTYDSQVWDDESSSSESDSDEEEDMD